MDNIKGIIITDWSYGFGIDGGMDSSSPSDWSPRRLRIDGFPFIAVHGLEDGELVDVLIGTVIPAEKAFDGHSP